MRYAVDYDGDGRRDIWTSLPDVFASIANYLAKAGWNDRHTWGRKVSLPAALDGGLVGPRGAPSPLPEWQALGVRRADGADCRRWSPWTHRCCAPTTARARPIWCTTISGS